MDYVRMTSANQLLGDFDALQGQYEEQGYLYFGQVLDVDLVSAAAIDIVRVLTEQGICEGSANAPRATGLGIESVDQRRLYSLTSYGDLVNSILLQKLLDQVFNEPVNLFRSVNLRYACPNDSLHETPPHQDHFFVGPHDDFRTVWVPLMDIPQQVGGLAIAHGSHKGGLRAHVEHEVAQSYVLPGRKQKGVPLREVHERWATVEYKRGDVLIFHAHAVHRGLPNTSELVRLSLDVRCQPASRPLTFQARTTMVEQLEYRSAVKVVAEELELDEATFEIVMIDMQKNGYPADRSTIEGIISTLI